MDKERLVEKRKCLVNLISITSNDLQCYKAKLIRVDDEIKTL